MAAAAEVTPMATSPDYRLARDLRASASLMGREEARYLVDIYYTVQDYRIRTHNQARDLGKADEPHAIITWAFDLFAHFEGDVQKALGEYAKSQTPGLWALSIHGIGPVLAAGLLAHIDITRANTAGAIWRFAGLDPTMAWLGKEGARKAVNEALGDERFSTVSSAAKVARHVGRDVVRLAKMGLKDDQKWTRDRLIAALARRPWNAALKTLCWKIGDSFMKHRASDSDIYGKVYAERKELEVKRNEDGEFFYLAERSLREKKIQDKDLRATLEAGRLPAGRLELRARRYAVKIFLSHYHHVAYESHYGKPPPKPYIIEHGGHTHFLAPPNWPL